MAKSISFGGFQFGVAEESSAEPIGSRTPFRIAILGDFSGRSNRNQLELGAALAARRPRVIDRDNYDEVLAKLSVRLEHTISESDGAPVAIEFKELDDFHPDRLFASLPLFAHLRQLRRRLLKQDTFAEAAAEVRGWGTAVEPSRAQEAEHTDHSAKTSPPASEMTVEDIFEKSIEATPLSSGDAADVNWSRLVAEIVQPYIVPGADPQQGELVACVDAATAKSMSALLHHPDLQALEAAWRGLDFLTRRLETDASLKIFLIDVSKQELAADLTGSDDLAATGLYRLIVEQTVGTPGAEPWALLLGNFVFDAVDEDAELLGRLSKLAAAAHAPFLAASSGSLVGCDDAGETPDPDDWRDPPVSETWSALRQLAEASFTGLLWPRFLLRLPYGKRTDPTESFKYEETLQDWSHNAHAWGNPVFAFGCLMGQAFTQSGWSLRPGDVSEIRDLPVHIQEVDGEREALPCGELLLSERGVDRVLSQGVMPILSLRGQDAIRLGSAQSLTGRPLQGRWS